MDDSEFLAHRLWPELRRKAHSPAEGKCVISVGTEEKERNFMIESSSLVSLPRVFLEYCLATARGLTIPDLALTMALGDTSRQGLKGF